ncbi:hypothetical protein [Scytonema hofmannii]|uniref:hypothetical protein n=1 Tax=Scytonema hofmannii TaxID=34078 RepID=UPI00191C7E3C|nr:hypothetical protein [Scytonema hofmannii]
MTYPMALLDACVLYSAPLRDLLMWLAIEGVYAPKWSEMITVGTVARMTLPSSSRLCLSYKNKFFP